MTDFWPSDITDPKGIVPPISVMREAATELGTKTGWVLRGEIETIGDSSTGNFAHIFFVIAPKLDNYRYEILRVTHGISLYPAIIRGQGDDDFRRAIGEDILRKRGDAAGSSPVTPNKCDNPDELRIGLQKVFASPAIQEVVRSLLAQGRAA